MNLYGLQKVTLLDFPGHVACTVFTGGCDFRCPYCHNFQLASAPGPAQLSEVQFFSFLKSRLGRLDGVAVTGGEPCLHPGLPDFLKKIKALGFQTITLDSPKAREEAVKLLTQLPRLCDGA